MPKGGFRGDAWESSRDRASFWFQGVNRSRTWAAEDVGCTGMLNELGAAAWLDNMMM